MKDYLSPSGWRSWRSHPELPAGEVPRGPPEPRREKLPHLLSAGGGRRGGSAPLARLGEKLPALQIPGAGQWRRKTNESGVTEKNLLTQTIYSCLLQGDCAKVSSINDKSDWKMVRKALSVIEFSESDIEVSETEHNFIQIYY